MTTDELVAAFLRSRRAAHRAPATLEWYEYVLGRWRAAAPALAELATVETVEAFLSTAPSAESARNWLRALRAYSNWAQRRHGIPSPAHDVVPPRPRPQLPRVYTDGELRRIFDAARADWRDELAVTILLDTGIRIGELAGLRAERVELVGGGGAAITVDGKDGSRRVPISLETVRLLTRRAAPAGPVFVHGPGRKPFTTAGLGYRLRELVARAGISGRKVGPHTFRHTFATLYLRNGGDVYRLQRILGHASISQTMVYLHLSDPEAWAEHARISPLRIISRPQQWALPDEEAAV